MRPHNQLVHARTRVRPRFALMPLEGFPVSRFSTWPNAEVRVLASPALGARFVHAIIDLPKNTQGGMPATEGEERFYYVLDGSGEYRAEDGHRYHLSAGSFGLLPPGSPLALATNVDTLRVLLFRKRFQSDGRDETFSPVIGHEGEVAGQPWADTDKIRLQTLIPDELQYDMAMNIFSFTPGFGLPIVETHVMEHGLLFLQGKGLYHLDGEWMEVEKDDYIWMGPYCPQSFYAAGSEPAKYIYYKDVNREIAL
jgi:(S)-ureidoglycine aminohydrolase